ncbi:hypothetical protein [Sagittula salina]|uniref:Uncharacterized protein n=1 Tax=Sagittula salina TaxID=2820268 RepID=A0A940S4V8_9RHOB|nr:hypothetical protein [Sagittula salina]MBP0484519.1 hypothetical protein [Sagittula salina]
MAKNSNDDFRFRAQAILAVRHARALAEQLTSMPDVPIGDLPRSSLNATLRRLETGEVTEGRDLVVLETLEAGFAERMAAEITGSTVEARHIGYDEDGEIWAWETVPSYSPRGEKARALHSQLKRFLELRQDLLDHSAAERLAAQLLR